MGGGHSHGIGDEDVKAPRASERTVTILASIVGLVAFAVAMGAASVWPKDFSFWGQLDPSGPNAQWVHVTVTDLDETTGEYSAVIEGKEDEGERALYVLDDPTYQVAVGDSGRALLLEDGTLAFSDYERGAPLIGLAIAFAVLVILVARWRGLGSLVGLVLAFGVVILFTIPALFGGGNALVIGLVTAAGALFLLLYLAHGINARTTTAFLGTLAGVGVTAVLGWWAVTSSHILGFYSEDGLHMELFNRGVSLQGLVLCGIVLAGLGILNDVTITQASAVWELHTLRPDLGPRALFVRAMRIGRDHIASTVYTIAFAYVGAALPTLMIVSLYAPGVGITLTSSDIAEEVVRTLVGSIGLVLAVPLTTAIGALVVSTDTAGGKRAAREADADDEWHDGEHGSIVDTQA